MANAIIKNRRLKGIFFVGVLFFLLAVLLIYLFVRMRDGVIAAAPGEKVELIFELDKKFEFGEYYFDLENGKDATCSLCYCLSQGNVYPPDCRGDIMYIYNNLPGTACIPLHIGKGACSIKNIMNTEGYSTMFIIPLEYRWTKPVEKIVMGIKVPELAKKGEFIIVEITILRKNERGKLEHYRTYQKTIRVRNK